MEKNDRSFEKAWSTALMLLARRGHTVRELKEKLRRRGFETQTAATVVSECEKLKCIDDEETGRAYLKELVRKGYGPSKIRCALARKGVDVSVIEGLLEESGVEERERDLCLEVLRKKLKTASKMKEPEKIKARLYRFLLSRGFSGSVVCGLLGDCAFDE